MSRDRTVPQNYAHALRTIARFDLQGKLTLYTPGPPGQSLRGGGDLPMRMVVSSPALIVEFSEPIKITNAPESNNNNIPKT